MSEDYLGRYLKVLDIKVGNGIYLTLADTLVMQCK